MADLPDKKEQKNGKQPQKRNATSFKPGQVANPAGRPKGSRNKLSETFIAALFKDFEGHGEAAIVAMRQEKPNEYVKVIAGLIPAQFQAVDKDGEAAEMSLTVVFAKKGQ